ncbi:MAG: enoyl-CoA hydratase/isomerase family protein [Acidimicrobiia bacterium]
MTVIHSDSAEGTVVWQQQDSLVTLTLHRPHAANAYTASMLAQLDESLHRIESDPAISTVVITGAERWFCAGADHRERDTRDWRSVVELPSARVFQRLARCPAVTIAAVNGAAVGGGLELALAADLRFACATATFALPELTLGLLPAAGGMDRLPELVGPMAARQLILGGVVWSADDAFRHGLILDVAPDLAGLRQQVADYAGRIATQETTALRLAKQRLSSGVQMSSDATRLAQALLVARHSNSKAT